MIINEYYHIYLNGSNFLLVTVVMSIALYAVIKLTGRRKRMRSHRNILMGIIMLVSFFAYWNYALWGQDYDRQHKLYSCEQNPKLGNVQVRLSDLRDSSLTISLDQ